MELIIKEAEQLPAQIETLLKLANKEGVNVVQRLIDEYASGQNRFQDEGEFFLIAYDGDKLIGCGGLNQQREEEGQKSRIGRVRRFYVHPKYRRHGVGKDLLAYLETKAKPNFSALCLQTYTRLAADFYQKQNYVWVENNPSYNYFKYLI